MSKKTFHTVFGGFTLVVVTMACSLSGSSPSATQLPNDDPTNNNIPTKSISTENPTLPIAPTPELGLKQEWTIKTGNIQYIGVASDGTIYGVGPNLYAVISKDGEVLQTNDIDLTDCLRDNFSGGSGDTEIDRWFVAKPDGTLVTTTFIVPCVISPGNPPTVEIIQDSHFFSYTDDNIFPETPTTPQGFTNNFGATYLFFSRLNDFDFFFNAQQKTFGFVDHNGEIRYFSLPDEVDMGRYRGGGIQIAITPWDDVYYSYPTFDSLGNELGQKIVKIESDGTSKIVDNFPYIDTSTNTISDLTRMRPIYLPEQSELYFYQLKSLAVYDLDFNYLREYLLPPDFPKITYGVADSTKKLFVGHDGAVYVFETGFSDKTLTKYLLPNQNVQIESQPTQEEEIRIFRNKALQTIQELETVEYSIKQTISGSQNEAVTGYGKATHNATHEIYYKENGDVRTEIINVDNTTCSRADVNWTCNPQGGFSFFSVINDVLNGASPTYYPSEGESLTTWSELKTYNGIECRSFFIESLYPSTNSKYSDEICFDIKNYFPIHWLTIITYLDNGFIISES